MVYRTPILLSWSRCSVMYTFLMKQLKGFSIDILSWITHTNTATHIKNVWIPDCQQCKNVKFCVWLSSCQSKLMCYMSFYQIRLFQSSVNAIGTIFFNYYSHIDTCFHLPQLKIQFSSKWNYSLHIRHIP